MSGPKIATSTKKVRMATPTAALRSDRIRRSQRGAGKPSRRRAVTGTRGVPPAPASAGSVSVIGYMSIAAYSF